MTESAQIRQRVAEALSRNGLNEQAVAAEVLLLLPAEFVDQYESLFLLTWGGSGGLPGERRREDPNAAVASPKVTQWRVSSGQTETRGAAAKRRGVGVSRGLGVADVRAAATKEWADRKLRKLARDIRLRLTDEGVSVRRCTGSRCRRIAEDAWNYCPACGAPTEDVVL